MSRLGLFFEPLGIANIPPRSLEHTLLLFDASRFHGLIVRSPQTLYQGMRTCRLALAFDLAETLSAHARHSTLDCLVKLDIHSDNSFREVHRSINISS